MQVSSTCLQVYVHKAMYNFEEHDQLVLALLDSRVSHSRWSNIEVTLLVIWYRFVTPVRDIPFFSFFLSLHTAIPPHGHYRQVGAASVSTRQ